MKTFTERFNQLKDGNDFSFSIARYSKNMVALRFHSDGTGLKTWSLKTWSNMQFDRMGKSRFSNREKAYIISVAKAEKFLKQIQD